MSDSSGQWDIRNLADLILGPGNTPAPSPGAPVPPRESASETTPDPKPSENIISNVVLVDREQNAIEAVSRYADYWSNRSQAVAVAWVGESEIKLGLFDYLRRVVWAGEITEAVESRRFDELCELMNESLRRVVVAVRAVPGWQDSPLVRRCRSVCVLVEPSPDQLIRAYECLKYLATNREDCQLSCFVQEALSARQATELSTRLQDMGERFLNCDIDFEGFSLSEQWPNSNLVAETLIGEDGSGSMLRMRDLLLRYLDRDCDDEVRPSRTVEASSRMAHAVSVAASTHEEARSALPTVRAIRVQREVRDVAELDRMIGDVIEEICGAGVETWPIYSATAGDCRLRWVFREDGGRSIVVSAFDCARGALERAAAQMHPGREGDEIIVLARCLSTDYRKAAQNLTISTRLYEVSQLPPDGGPTLLLKDVSDALD
ncbi:MAG: hypothetical protein IH895_09765 [Planctomycetes bacterium]|nr:hypothetical protein [Planctomycetota bacterium]